ncbi:trehalose-phosphatase [Thioclava sp. 15-R06ZXC-3]|uniref:Trehalose 6-phosphate phosphatase n=1 Tax=Thioclava arctica TaxID=3238301 RepID=A0ABV3TIM3_9RHOB
MILDDSPQTKPGPPALNPYGDALFLDFDGCLVEIAPTPDAIKVPDDLPHVLQELAARLNGALAIVSGRSLHELETFLQGFDGPMVGSHGAEARGMTAPMAHQPVGLSDLQQEMADFASQSGLLYEHKSHGGAVHFRSDPTRQAQVEGFAHALAERYRDFTVQPAKMAVELRPTGFSKDGALVLLSELSAFEGRRPVYAGDDTTDEPALAWAEANGGFGIKIGAGESVARFRLPEPQQLRGWLSAALEGEAWDV